MFLVRKHPTKHPGGNHRSFEQRAVEQLTSFSKAKLNSQVPEKTSTVSPPVANRGVNTAGQINLVDAIVLVSCVKSKLPYSAPARSLYTSTWFRKTRDLVEASGARWFILSALYGLVVPIAEIALYERTLNTLGIAERRDWATKVLEKLLPQISEKRVVIFAGRRYREFLFEPLEQSCIKVEVPMEHLAQGEQLAWLSDCQ